VLRPISLSLDLLYYVRVNCPKSTYQSKYKLPDVLLLLILYQVSDSFKDLWEVEVGFYHKTSIFYDTY
jgi:hypothetical protein